MFIVKGQWKQVVEDSYNDGEIGNYELFDLNFTCECETLEEVKKEISSFTDNDSFYYDELEKGCIEVSVLETSWGNTPTDDDEYEQWKDGHEKLFSVTYRFYVYEANLVDFNQ